MDHTMDAPREAARSLCGAGRQESEPAWVRSGLGWQQRRDDASGLVEGVLDRCLPGDRGLHGILNSTRDFEVVRPIGARTSDLHRLEENTEHRILGPVL